jgi:type I restriction enzyme S subunit
MMDGLKPYPAYKDSGVPWPGTGHWEVKGRSIGRSQYTGVTLRRERLAGEGDLLTNAASLVGYKRVKPGDLVMNIMLAWNGSLGVSSITGIVSPSYCVFRTKRDGVDSRFLHYLFRTSSYTGAFKTVSTGVVDSRLRLYPDVFLRLPSLVPPLPEQTAIVRFLDYRDRRIRRSIRAKQKLIKLLEEYRQALIHQAVTGKIDVRTGKPYPAYKDSGVPWLGKVPEQWEVRRIKRMCWVQGGYAFPSSLFCEIGVPVVRMNNLRRGILNMDDVVRIPERECIRAFYLKAGDILYGLSGSIGPTGSLGNYAVVAERDLPCLLNQRVARIVPKQDNIESTFLVQIIQTSVFYEQVLEHTTGTAQFNVSTNDINNVQVAVPPLPEQTAIVEYLDAQTAKLDAAIAAARREIELLREYRERLIADVVTGKVDVREVAAQLPEEPPEEEVGTEEEEPVAEELATVDSQEESNGEE